MPTSPVRVARKLALATVHRPQNFGQESVYLFFGHTRANIRVIGNVEKILVVDIEVIEQNSLLPAKNFLFLEIFSLLI